MRIASIALKDFRAYESASMQLDEPLTIVRGANHQGKTSLAQAIQLSLAKRSDGTDPRGAGANDKIRVGASKAILDLVMETKNGQIAVKTSYGPNKTGRQQSIVVDAFAQYLENNSQRLSCVLDSEYFVGLKAEEQKSVLAALVLPSSYEFDAEMTALAEKHLGAFVWTGNPVHVIDQAYSAAYASRRDSKATLAGIQIPQKPPTPENTIEDIESELAGLRAKAQKEQKKIKQGPSAEIAKLEQSIHNQQERLTEAHEEHRVAKQRDTSYEAQILDGPALTTIRKVTAGRKVWNDLQAKIDDALRDIEAQQDAIAIYEGLRKDPYCPTCTQGISDTFIEGKIASHRQMQQESQTAQANLVAEQAALGDIADAESRLDTHLKAVAAKLETVKAVAAATDRINKAETEIRRLNAELVKVKASDTGAPDTSVLDEINLKIAQWEEALRPAIHYNTVLAQIEREEKRWQEQKAKVNDLEKLCDYFGKDGVKASLIQEHIETFEQAVNKILSHWGYTASLTIEPYEFNVTTVNGVTLPLKELSGSERMMFGVALQCAIAAESKIRMVMIDRADTMINGERGRLFACLKGMLDSGQLDQAIVLVADDREAVPEQDGVAFYRVTEGRIDPLGQRAGQRETAAA